MSNFVRPRRLATVTFMVLALGSFGNQALAGKKQPPGGGSGWSNPTAISPVNQPDPTRGSQLNDVAVNANGLTIAAWDQFTYDNGGGASIGVAIQSGGTWDAPFTISALNGYSTAPRVAVGADGTMAVSWTHPDPATGQPQIQVAVRPAGSTAWITSTLATGIVGGVAITQFVPVGIDGSGNVTAAWSLWDGAKHVVQSSTKLAGGDWSPAVSISSAHDGIYPALAMNASGNAAVVFSTSPYTSIPGSCGVSQGTCALYAYRSGPESAFSTPVLVSEVIPNTVGYVTHPQVALDGNGLATVIYMGYGLEATRENFGVEGNTWTTPAPVILSSVAGASYLSPDLAVDANGNAVVVVSIFDPTINVDRASVWVTQGTADGSWSPQQRLTDPGVPVDAYATRAAISPDGTLTMIGWIDHYNGVAQVAKLADGSWNTTTIGRETAYSAFQEVLGLDIGSGAVARAIWKSAKTGTQTMAVSFGG